MSELTKSELATSLAVETLAHCRFDKKGRLVMKSNKANEYLKYMKSIYFEMMERREE